MGVSSGVVRGFCPVMVGASFTGVTVKVKVICVRGRAIRNGKGNGSWAILIGRRGYSHDARRAAARDNNICVGDQDSCHWNLPSP